jgi:signal transduction histidine kinase
MIVDDNVQNLYLLETLLKNNGYDVISAKNGAEALDLAREAVPDLIITDILMPVMDGFELCRIWKADEQLKHVPFIFYTATYTDAKDEQFALSLGAERFIIKPQQPEVLVQIVTEILDDFNKGEINPVEKPLGAEMEFLREYNAVLFHKLEMKVVQLEEEIIERKNAQGSLMQLNEELEARVEERTKALKEAQERMMRQEKLAAIGKLAGSVGHELRNPLGVITNSIYYLGLKLSANDEKIRKHLRIIQEESERANEIISQLLDFARMKNDENTTVDINSLINQTLERTQKPDNVTVTTCLSEHLPTILIGSGRMAQVFQNIIVNAFQAMPEGGELEITDICDNDVIEIAFKDSGVGISPENLQHMFEPLFSTKIKGIGLGLSIAKEIVEQFKGTIEVKSEVGVGSTFLVKLPLGVNDNNF